MNKIYLRLLLPFFLLFLVVGFAGCGDDDDNDDVTPILKTPIISIQIDKDLNSPCYVSDMVNFTLEASSENGTITEAALYLNGKLLFKDISEPFTGQWVPQEVGTYEFFAQTIDEKGQQANSDLFEIEVLEDGAPIVEILSPSSDSRTFGNTDTIPVAYTVKDEDEQIKPLRFLIDGKVFAEVTGDKEGSYDLIDVPEGIHVLQLEAEDSKGQIGKSEEVTFTVLGNFLGSNNKFEVEGIVQDLVSSNDNNIVFGLNKTLGELFIIDIPNLYIERVVLPENNPQYMKFSKVDNKLYIISENSGSVTVWDVVTRQFSEIEFSDSADSQDIAIDEINRRVYVLAGNSVYIMDMDQGTVIIEENTSLYGRGSIALDNQRQLYLANKGLSPSSLSKYDVSNDNMTFMESIRSGGNARSVETHPNGGFVVLPCGGGNGPGYTLYLFDSQNLKNVLDEYDIGTYPKSVAFDPAGELLIGSNGSPYDNQLYVYDLQSGNLVKNVEVPHVSDFSSFTTTANGQKIVVFSYDTYYRSDHAIYIRDLVP